jgi:hypothetical protein
MPVPESSRRLVIARAAGCCEYCRMRQSWEPFHAYHVEHIVAKQHRGTDEIGNLALACHHCNLFKGPNLTSRDPDGDALVTLFHPRNSQWTDHFRIDADRIIGLTDIGRTTVFLLEMNADQRVDLRWINRDLTGELS